MCDLDPSMEFHMYITFLYRFALFAMFQKEQKIELYMYYILFVLSIKKLLIT